MINKDAEGGMKLNLIEVNQHPYMHANERLKKFKSKFENILYNTFNLVGVGTYWKKGKFDFNSDDEEEMAIGLGSYHAAPEMCTASPCSETCDQSCDICPQCLTEDKIYSMKMAYLEHMNMGEFKRIFPPANVSFESFYQKVLSPKINRW